MVVQELCCAFKLWPSRERPTDDVTATFLAETNMLPPCCHGNPPHTNKILKFNIIPAAVTRGNTAMLNYAGDAGVGYTTPSTAAAYSVDNGSMATARFTVPLSRITTARIACIAHVVLHGPGNVQNKTSSCEV